MSTRQATPGPSTGTSSSVSLKKRLSSENPENLELRESKKVKRDLPSSERASVSISTPTSAKDSRKRRRKKKRKTSVVVVVAESEQRTRSNSRSTPAAPTSLAGMKILSASVSPKSIFKPVANVVATDAGTVLKSLGKGKGKATSEPPSPAPSKQTSASVISAISDSSKAQIAALQSQLAEQAILLEKHQNHLSQIFQSLTCQICLDLLHKPYALAPCGHVACYPCLVRWFTEPPSDNNNNSIENDINGVIDEPRRRGSQILKRKTCPECRAIVAERPVEVWSIKSMVSSLIRSGLIDLPAPVPTNGEGVSNQNVSTDPWNNIFRKRDTRHQEELYFSGSYPYGQVPPPAQEGNQEDMGMYDSEDGGIYRCIDCMHEIMDGECTHCQRVYLGHDQFEDDEEEFNDLRGALGRDRMVHMLNMLGQRTQRLIDDGASDGSVDEAIALMEESLFDSDEGIEYGDMANEIRLNNVDMEELLRIREEFPLPYEDVTDEEESAAGLEEISDDDEEGYDSSFIENDERSRHANDVIDLIGSSNDEDDAIESARRRRRACPIIITSDEDDSEDENHREVARRLGRESRFGGRWGGGPVVIDNEESVEESVEGDVHIDGRRVIDSDDEIVPTATIRRGRR